MTFFDFDFFNFFFTGKGGGPLRVGEGGSSTRRGGGSLTKNLGSPLSLYICDFEPILGLGAYFDHMESLTILRVREGVPYA